jgi:hypothetical protein
VARARIGAEVADEGVVHDGVGTLGAEDVLHLPLAQVEHVHAEPGGMAFPRLAVHARQRERAGEASRDEASLATGDAGDEHLLAGLRAALRMLRALVARGLRHDRRGRTLAAEMEQLLRSVEWRARHGKRVGSL